MTKATKRKARSLAGFDVSTWGRCRQCSGTGLGNKLFHHSDDHACVGCNGVGWLPPDGEMLSEAEALVFLRLALNRKNFAVRSLRRDARRQAPEHPLVEFYRSPGYKGD